jgi:hypothetical protein
LLESLSAAEKSLHFQPARHSALAEVPRVSRPDADHDFGQLTRWVQQHVHHGFQRLAWGQPPPSREERSDQPFHTGSVANFERPREGRLHNPSARPTIDRSFPQVRQDRGEYHKPVWSLFFRQLDRDRLSVGQGKANLITDLVDDEVRLGALAEEVMADLPKNPTIDELYEFRPTPGGLRHVRETIHGDDDCIARMIGTVSFNDLQFHGVDRSIVLV